MTAIETPTSTQLSPEARQALRVRQNAAMKIVEFCDEDERWDLLVAVVWPSDPLLGLTLPSSSVSEPS